MQKAIPAVDIPLSKRKNLIMLLLCLAFVLASWFIWRHAGDEPQASLFRAVALAGFMFFGVICGGYGLYKLFDNRPGLVLDKIGINDNSSALGGRLIKWGEVVRLEEREVYGTPFLLVFVTNPEEVIRKEPFIQQKAMRLNYKLYGTPVALSASALTCTFEEMARLVREAYGRHGGDA
ncbi:STM3941 family protein [Rufibacter quisquiliarum]|uniref:PH domain-containing protein n=1 Tax=Rufibacter quisquiliarum TaxID=1549639 RepID=A0A839GKZ0_9BACT|nr:STM3941 family protein [Rufibacter quisquiliarum]MBA9075666.1 hypothetical protein [Rufibacter quisquiliarum]